MKRNRGHKSFKGMICFILSFLLVLTDFLTIPAEAMGSDISFKKVYLQYRTVYLDHKIPKGVTEPGGRDDGDQEIEFSIKVSNDNYIERSSVCSSDERVVWLEKDAIKEEPASVADKDYHIVTITGYPKNPGNADIIFKDKDGNEYALHATVLPYENPIKVMKIANVKKGKNLAHRTNWGISDGLRYSYLTFAKKTASSKLKIKAKKNWTINTINISLECHNSSYQKPKSWKMNLYGLNRTSKTIKLKKVCKGDMIMVSVWLTNDDTKEKQFVIFGDWN